MFFDIMAKDFDTKERIERSKRIAAEIRSKAADGLEKTAMEYGCGTGLVGLRLTDAFKSLLLVDSSKGMIEQVNKKLSGLDCPNVSVLCRDFMAEPPSGLRADYIFSSLVLHHIKDIDTILSLFYGMLTEGGRLLLVDINKDDGSFHADNPDFDGHNGFVQSELAEMAAKAGFAQVVSETFYSGTENVNGRDVQMSLFLMEARK